MSSRQTRVRKQAGIKLSATQTINWTVPPDQISLSQPIHGRNNHNNHTNNSRHGYSNTQPLQNVIANINFTDPQSPRYQRSDGQIEVSTNKHKHKPLPSRPLTPINKTKRNMFNISSIATRRRQKHTGSTSNTLQQSWHTKYLKLEEKYNKLLSDKNDLQQKHGALSRSYKELQTKYQDKCAECNHLLQEKKELNRNLDAIRRRDSVAKSHKSDADNISLSGDFSDNKSEYSAIGIAAMKHQLIASPSQSALSSIPPYQPNNQQSIYNKMTNKIYSKYNNNNNNNNINNNTPHSNPSNNGIFSDDGNESETSSNIGINPNRYNRIGGYHANNNNPTRYTTTRATNGSYSSMESDNTNNAACMTPNGSQRFNIKKKQNSYKSLDHYDEENPDPYARVDLI